MEKVGQGTIWHCDSKHLAHNKASFGSLVLSPSVLLLQTTLALMLAIVSCCQSKMYKLFGVDTAITWVALLLL